MTNSHYSAIRRVTWTSVGVNVALAAGKLIVGVTVGSLALISDGIDSLSDLTSDGVVLVGSKWANKPPDEDHHYGHGKLETFAELILALFILFAAGSILTYCAQSVIRGEVRPFHWEVAAIASVSVGIKEWLYRFARAQAARHGAMILEASAWHYRSDALSSLVVLIGAVFGWLGIPYADAVSGGVVGLMVAWLGWKILKRGLLELSEVTPGPEWERRVKSVLESMSPVLSYHKLRLRRLGSRIFMDMHIMVDPEVNIRVAHDIATELEVRIKKELGAGTNVLVHVEPFVKEHVDL